MIKISGVEYVTTEEAAGIVGRSVATVRSWCAKGKMEGAIKATERSSWLIPVGALEQMGERGGEVADRQD